MSLYFILLISSIALPLLLSFDSKVAFYRKWKYLFSAILLVAIVFIVSDILLTRNGVWGFNHLYHSSIVILGLPMEELLFFIVVPYASLFLHYSIVNYFPKLRLSSLVARRTTLLLLVVLLLIAIGHSDKTYTLYITLKLPVVLLISLFDRKECSRSFYITFLLILIPFIIVNGTLTGSFFSSEVVWYNNSENLGIRLLTIPIEDFLYAFALLFSGLMLTEYLQGKQGNERDV